MFHEKLRFFGNFKASLIDGEGNVVASVEKNNLIVSSGYALAISRLSGSGNALTHMGIGTSSVAPAPGDTDLGAPLARVVFDVPGGAQTGATVLYYCTIPAGVGTGAVSEAGLFNAAAAGTMFSRLTFTTMNKTALLALAISWSITASA